MNVAPLVISIVLIVMALISQRGLLAAICFATLVGQPVFQPTSGLRSAVYAQELVIAAAFFIWLLRHTASEEVTPVSSTMVPHLILIGLYIIMVTMVGYIRMGEISSIPIRVPLAGLRFGAVALAFVIPASMPLSSKEFISTLRIVLFAVSLFAMLSLFEAAGVFKITKPMALEVSAREGARVGMAGFSDVSTGTFAFYGIFVTVLLLWLHKLPKLWAAICVPAFVALLLLSLARTSFITMFVFGLLLVLMSRGNRAASLTIFLLGLVTILVVAMAVPAVSSRLATIAGVGQTTTALEEGGRLPGWIASVKHLTTVDLMTCVFGAGFDCWQFFLAPYTGLYAGHNVYLHAWGELGLIGGAIYLAFFFRILKRFWHASRGEGDTRKIGRLSFCLMLSLLVANLTADMFYPTTGITSSVHGTMFLFGLIIGRLRHPSAWVEEDSLDALPEDNFEQEPSSTARAYVQ